MGFNYGLEKKKFDDEWKKKAAWYRAEGMSEDAIQALYVFDWDEFKSRRRYVNHTQALPNESIAVEDEHSFLIQKHTELTITFSEVDFTDRYAWVETIDHPELVHKLKQLAPHELEILTLLAFDGYTQKKAAEQMGIPYRTFKYQLQKIKIFLQ